MKTQTFKFAAKVLRHMHQQGAGKKSGIGMLLAGDPGIGKTTFVETFSMLLGVQAVVIEVPHITEEHLINIPFLVVDKNGTKSAHLTHAQAPGENAPPSYKIVLADSSLYTAVAAATGMNDQQYLEHMKKCPAAVQQLYMQFGGTETTIPPLIQDVRQYTHTILFLDEFYRQTTMRVRNILRSILNGYIGKDKIPNHAYIMYASNMNDSGLEELASNANFIETSFKAPSRDEWFDWFVGKFKEHARVELNMSVVNKFKKLLKDEHISYEDGMTSIRTSPRRWEQLLLYINSSLPVKNRDDARALISNVKNNFVDTDEDKFVHSNLHAKVVDAVIELVKETSNVEVTKDDALEDHEWRDALLHQVERAVKLGPTRKYIPVVSGPPGIGKTTEALYVAEKFNMRLISIDASELNAEDTTGMAIPANQKDDSMEVQFSFPKLYQQVLSLCKQEDAAYIKELREQHGDQAQEKIEQYKNQENKYLVFIDELSRVDEKTFNALRRVMLERNFGPDGHGGLLKLPEGSILVGAMNPTGEGTSPLTKHFKDVIDVIPSGASWDKTRKYLGNIKIKAAPEVMEASLQIIDAFVRKFQSRDDDVKAHVKPFNLQFNGQTIPIQPREYETMYKLFVRELDWGIKDILADESIPGDGVREHVDELVGECFEDSLNFILSKAQMPKEEIVDMIKTWVGTIDDRIFGALVTKKVSNVDTLSGVLTKYLTGQEPVTNMTNDVHIVNNNNTLNNAQVIDEMKELLARALVDKASIEKLVIDESHAKVEINQDEFTLKLGTAKVSLLENLILSLLFTLHLHEYANDRLNVIGKGLNTAISDVLSKLVKAGKVDEDTKMDASVAAAGIRGDVHELISELS